MKFRSVEQAVRFAFATAGKGWTAQMNLLGTRGKSEFSPQDIIAQRALIILCVDGLPTKERLSVYMQHARGDTQKAACLHLAGELMPVFRDGTRELVADVLMNMWGRSPSIRTMAARHGIGKRAVEEWRRRIVAVMEPTMFRASDLLHAGLSRLVG